MIRQNAVITSLVKEKRMTIFILVNYCSYEIYLNIYQDKLLIEKILY